MVIQWSQFIICGWASECKVYENFNGGKIFEFPVKANKFKYFSRLMLCTTQIWIKCAKLYLNTYWYQWHHVHTHWVMLSGVKWKKSKMKVLQHLPVCDAAHFWFQDPYYTTVHANGAEWVMLSMVYSKWSIFALLMITNGCGAWWKAWATVAGAKLYEVRP